MGIPPVEQGKVLMTGILDYGLGNLYSLEKAFRRIHEPFTISRSIAELRLCDRFVLAGVGHFAYGMSQLQETGLDHFLTEEILGNQKPVLGICLGMQLLGEFSEEGNAKGLGFVQGKIKKISVDPPFKVPHMGWNTTLPQDDMKLIHPSRESFYFTHSFAFDSCADCKIATTEYGGKSFVSALEKSNIFAVQFHPEKSFDQGLQLLKNFCSR